MSRCGAAGIFVEANAVAQSCLLRGDHNFQPLGQEFFCVDLEILRPFVTLTSWPVEYNPLSLIRSTTQLAALPLPQGVLAV